MANKLKKFFGFVLVILTILALYKFKPPMFCYGLLGLGYTIYCVFIFMKGRWIESEPNEWLLIIYNGRLIKSGIGLKCFMWPF